MKKPPEKADAISRREFVQKSALSVGVLAAPMYIPRRLFGASAPSNRIRVGHIGCGRIGQGGVRGAAGALDRAALNARGISNREADELLAKLAPAATPDFELDLGAAKSAEHFAERFAAAVPGADGATDGGPTS